VHSQTLRATTVKETEELTQSIVLTDTNNNTLTVTPTSNQKVTFKANSLLTGYDRLSLVLYDSDGAESMPIAFKFYKESLPTISTGELDNINTLSTGTLDQGKLTSINFSEYKSQENPLASLNILLPESTIGVLAINYIRNLDDDNIDSPFICITDSSTTELKIFNNSGWWDEDQENNRFGKQSGNQYHLREGLNLVQFDNSCSIGFYAPIQESATGLTFTNNDILIFSNLVMIKTSDSIPKLNKKLALKSDTAAILDTIKHIDPEMQFYYTIPIDQNSGLDLNEADEEDTLACPKNWFDTNNVNNKFVISKLDTGYLIKNVKVSKYSLR
jgi:hypothetical protein